jgi:ribosomal protein S18 acetylase RimI-like enzyme
MCVATILQTRLGELAVDQARTDEQAGSVLELRDDLARWMLEQHIEQWRPGEIPLEWIQTCVYERRVYVVPRDERIIAAVTILWDDPLMWGERSERAGYIHMLMVDRNFAGYDIGSSLLAWTEGLILNSGRHLARLDCVRSNRRLRAYYERAGYQLVGYNALPEVEWAFEAALYEKPLRR